MKNSMCTKQICGLEHWQVERRIYLADVRGAYDLLRALTSINTLDSEHLVHCSSVAHLCQDLNSAMWRQMVREPFTYRPIKDKHMATSITDRTIPKALIRRMTEDQKTTLRELGLL